MSPLKLSIVPFLAITLLISGCSKSHTATSGSQSSAPVAGPTVADIKDIQNTPAAPNPANVSPGAPLAVAAATATPTPTPVDEVSACPKPDVFTVSPSAQEMTLDQLKQTLSGGFELTEASSYSIEQDGSNTVRAVLASSVQVEYAKSQGDQPKNTEIKKLCSVDSNPIEFSSLLAAQVYFPSTRVTIFDQGSNLDNPDFNYPDYAQFKIDNAGNSSVQMAIGEKPYTQNRLFSDYLATLAGKTKIYMTSSDAFVVLNESARNFGTNHLYLLYQRKH
jgi:hypothetical protein